MLKNCKKKECFFPQRVEVRMQHAINCFLKYNNQKLNWLVSLHLRLVLISILVNILTPHQRGALKIARLIIWVASIYRSTHLEMQLLSLPLKLVPGFVTHLAKHLVRTVSRNSSAYAWASWFFNWSMICSFEGVEDEPGDGEENGSISMYVFWPLPLDCNPRVAPYESSSNLKNVASRCSSSSGHIYSPKFNPNVWRKEQIAPCSIGIDYALILVPR